MGFVIFLRQMLNDLLTHHISRKSTNLVLRNDEYKFQIYHCIPKTGNYHLLLTDGLRNYEQPVNEDNKDLKFIELYICLPDYWNLRSKNWPITWLDRIAQVPQKQDTWFGIGDTIPAGNPPEKLDEKFKANHFIISSPKLLAQEFSGEKWVKESFCMLALIPIFQLETDYKLRTSYSMLFNKFKEKNIDERMDPFRQSVCKKRGFGLF